MMHSFPKIDRFPTLPITSSGVSDPLLEDEDDDDDDDDDDDFDLRPRIDRILLR